MKDVSLTIRKRKDSKKNQAILSIKVNNSWKQAESQGGFKTKIAAKSWAVPRLAEVAGLKIPDITKIIL
ncbi:hypothetical protein [Anaerococcus tetradius]|uniref:Uncharacterized protein n=1 Tax=Anaerococcus tetradius ATCC 35098 TaxID=525255 RepID=C2CFH0_9FIRM|nr:hypothetical protein [Anaerococcus tetradius]EEI83686.1 hypothetical protein HMPREF0077_0230 [Anaerococcus tetradius ATCC 35098]